MPMTYLPTSHAARFALLAALPAIAGLAGCGMMGDEDANAPITHTVRRADFVQEVVDQGEVESANNREIRCEVKNRNGGNLTILQVFVKEGDYVEPGDKLLQLNSSALEVELAKQTIVVNSSDSLVKQAESQYNAAVLAKREYELGTLVVEERTIRNELFVAEENLRRAEAYLQYTQGLAAKGFANAQQLQADRFALDKARNEVASAKKKLSVLLDYTAPKMLEELGSAVAAAETKLANERKSHQIEVEQRNEIAQQIQLCMIRSDASGRVVFANDYDRRGDAEFLVEPGATVRERQPLIRLPDYANMQVKARVSESNISQIKRGMPARIRLEAFGDKPLLGEVESVNQYPERSGWFSSNVREYAVFVRLVDPPPQIRPGLTAEVSIQVDQRDDALQAPVDSVYEVSGHRYCLIQKGESLAPREIQISAANDRFVVVEQGLSEADEVVLNPRRYAESAVRIDASDVSPEQVAAGHNVNWSPSTSARNQQAEQPTDGAPSDDRTAGERPAQRPRGESSEPSRGAE